MDAPSREPLRLMTEATLGAFRRPIRDLLTPLLLYKSVFVGEWLDALARNESDPAVRDALGGIVRETMREAIETVSAMRAWEATPHDPTAAKDAAEWAQRRAVEDLLHFKEGNNETGIYVAMRAPTAELRQRFVRLADVDRRQADLLRRLLGRRPIREGPDGPPGRHPLGAHGGRGDAGTLARAITHHLEAVQAGGEVVVRLVVSGEGLRHLRDEGRIERDGTAFGLPVDVDFGWRGECYSFVTDERVRLAELLSREGSR